MAEWYEPKRLLPAIATFGASELFRGNDIGSNPYRSSNYTNSERYDPGAFNQETGEGRTETSLEPAQQGEQGAVYLPGQGWMKPGTPKQVYSPTEKNMNYYGQRADAAQQRGAAQYNPGVANFSRNMQGSVYGEYDAAMRGQRPSVAEAQYQSSLDRNIAAQQASAASARGGAASRISAQRAAAEQGANMLGRSSADLAALRASEIAQARAGAAGLSSTMRAADEARAQQQLQADMYQRAINDQYSLGLYGQRQRATELGMQGAMGRQQFQAGEHGRSEGINYGANKDAANREMEWTQALAEGGGGILSSAATGKSDARAKEAAYRQGFQDGSKGGGMQYGAKSTKQPQVAPGSQLLKKSDGGATPERPREIVQPTEIEEVAQDRFDEPFRKWEEEKKQQADAEHERGALMQLQAIANKPAPTAAAPAAMIPYPQITPPEQDGAKPAYKTGFGALGQGIGSVMARSRSDERAKKAKESQGFGAMYRTLSTPNSVSGGGNEKVYDLGTVSDVWRKSLEEEEPQANPMGLPQLASGASGAGGGVQPAMKPPMPMSYGGGKRQKPLSLDEQARQLAMQVEAQGAAMQAAPTAVEPSLQASYSAPPINMSPTISPDAYAVSDKEAKEAAYSQGAEDMRKTIQSYAPRYDAHESGANESTSETAPRSPDPQAIAPGVIARMTAKPTGMAAANQFVSGMPAVRATDQKLTGFGQKLDEKYPRLNKAAMSVNKFFTPQVEDYMEAPSDKRAKTGVKGDELKGALDSMEPYTFNYKPGMGPPGRHASIMAQDAERNPISSSFVRRDPQGMRVIDTPLATNFNLAAESLSNQRLNRIEDRLGLRYGRRG